MNTYQKIDEARKLLELPDRASIEEIKANYRQLLNKWHPDKCSKKSAECNEMTRRIIAAYKVIARYCKRYKFSFTKEDVRNNLSPEERLFEQFGTDQFWGKDKSSE